MRTQITTQQDIKAKLIELLGHEVRIQNVAENDGDQSKIQIQGHGQLETLAESDHSNLDEMGFFVRFCDGYHGTSSVNFQPKHVEEIDKGVYLYQICLR